MEPGTFVISAISKKNTSVAKLVWHRLSRLRVSLRTRSIFMIAALIGGAGIDIAS